jgi:hypothetical protein
VDNCPVTADPNQANIDRDGINDLCGPPDDLIFSDSDRDGVPVPGDNRPSTPNPDEASANGDGFGDVCGAPMQLRPEPEPEPEPELPENLPGNTGNAGNASAWPAEG